MAVGRGTAWTSRAQGSCIPVEYLGLTAASSEAMSRRALAVEALGYRGGSGPPPPPPDLFSSLLFSSLVMRGEGRRRRRGWGRRRWGRGRGRGRRPWPAAMWETRRRCGEGNGMNEWMNESRRCVVWGFFSFLFFSFLFFSFLSLWVNEKKRIDSFAACLRLVNHPIPRIALRSRLPWADTTALIGWPVCTK